MKKSEKQNKHKALATTIVVHALLIILFTFLGLTYLDPKPEEGIAINFGQVSNASGDEFIESQENDQNDVNNQAVESSTETLESEIATQETQEAVTVNNKPKDKTKNTESDNKPKDPERSVDSRLNNLIKNSGQSGNSEGNTQGGGDMGNPKGDNNAPHNGNGGSGSDGNYILGSRKALEKPLPNYDCDEEGRVVVHILVNRSGTVIKAEAGRNIPQGAKTNTTSSCLKERARVAALQTKWQADSQASDLQEGYIVYNFQKR